MFGVFSFLSYDKLFINQIASPYCEILSPRFLRMDLASSVHTSKSQAEYFTVQPLHPVNK